MRSAAVVGMVGAGGIGVVLWEIIRGFQYAQTCAVLLILVVTVKYVLLVMRADNQGEGGILALTALLPPRRSTIGASLPILVGLGIFGSALLYGDGMITPAITVLSAVEGTKVITPLFEPYVVPVTLAILTGADSLPALSAPPLIGRSGALGA